MKRNFCNNEDASDDLIALLIGCGIIYGVLWLAVHLIRGIIQLVTYIFGLLEEVTSFSTGYYSENQDYIYSSEFAIHVLALVGAVYLSSHLFIPFCKLIRSLAEIITILPLIMLGWAFDILGGTILFIQKALVRPWNPDFENGAPTIENRH